MELVDPHGGVNSTRFGETAGQAHAGHAALPDYVAFVASTMQAFARMTAARSLDADDVAKVI